MLNLARALKADIYTGFIDKKKTFDTRGIRVHSLGVNRGPRIYRNLRIAKKFGQLKLQGYDAYIFSGVWCISAAKSHHPNVLYLHTPLRAIYDLRSYYMRNLSLPAKIALKNFAAYWVPKDRQYMKYFDYIAANSKNVKERVLKYYGKAIYGKTSVVYTGIETKKYKYKKSGDFYLSAARLDTLKRIDMIVSAFKKMPQRKLVIAGTGPDEQRLKKLASSCGNIKFLGRVSDRKMLQLYATCKATIAANVDEDLGLIAIESHASGKPIAVVREGGFLETVNRRNGVFFSSGLLPAAIERLERTKWDYKEIQESSQKYDIRIFTAKMKALVEKAARQWQVKKHRWAS